MTSIRTTIETRTPNRLAVTVSLAIGAIALVSGSVLLLRTTEPALAAAEEIASASSFRILAPQRLERLTGLTAPATTNVLGRASGQDTSCIAARASMKTDRTQTITPEAFCLLQRRLINAELIGQRNALDVAFRTHRAEAAGDLAFNTHF